MCCILLCRDNKPSKTIIHKVHQDNNHGLGLAYFKDGLAHYKKGMFPGELISFMETIELPFIVHARAASIGGKGLTLTHPYEITAESPLKFEGSAEKLLFHNGTVSNFRHFMMAADVTNPNQYDSMSDTRGLALILAKLNDDTKQINFLKEFKQKFVIVDSKALEFKIFGDFQFEDGIYYSNFYWKSQQVTFNEWDNKNEKKDIKNDTQKIVLPAPNGNSNKFTIPPKLKLDAPPVHDIIDSPAMSPLLHHGVRKFLKNPVIDINTKFVPGSKPVISCIFCGKPVEENRIQGLRVRGFGEKEMACMICSIDNKYSLPLSVTEKIPNTTAENEAYSG